MGLNRGGDCLGQVRCIGGEGLIADLHARLGACRRGDVGVVHRQTDQRSFDDIAAGGELLDASRIELERALGRIGRDRHGRIGEGRFQFRIGVVGDALEQREVGRDRQGKAGENDRLAAESSDSAPNRMKHGVPIKSERAMRMLAVTPETFNVEEEQRIELSAIPNHGFTGRAAPRSAASAILALLHWPNASVSGRFDCLPSSTMRRNSGDLLSLSRIQIDTASRIAAAAETEGASPSRRMPLRPSRRACRGPAAIPPHRPLSSSRWVRLHDL